MGKPKALTREQQRMSAALDAVRDQFGRLRCQHGYTDAARCALCKRLVLRTHAGWHDPMPEGVAHDAGCVPMPEWFRSGMHRPEQWRQPEQPALLGDEAGDER